MSEAIDDRTYEQVFDIEGEVERAGASLVQDPYPIWARLMAEAPVHKGTLGECMGLAPEEGIYLPGFEYFTALSFAAVSNVFTRKADFSSEFYHDIGIKQSLGDNILSMDGPRHRRYRNLIQEFFQPAASEGWWRERVIDRLVDELVGRFESADRVEINSQFFARLPMLTVTEAFGMSPREGMDFRRYTQVAIHPNGPLEERAEAAQASDRILQAVVQARQAEPQDDIISRLAVAELPEEDGSTRRLTVEEIVSYCRLIVFAGGGTTWRQLGTTFFALMNHRDQLEAVMADRSLLQNAVLEAARWNVNVPLFTRKAIRDTTLEGVEIPKGAVVHVCIGAANRDPSRWEDPDRFDVFRPIQRSAAFAAGHHSCLGQHVARQEIEAALNAIFDRFPNIRWDPEHAPPKLSGDLIHRGPGPLHVLLH